LVSMYVFLSFNLGSRFLCGTSVALSVLACTQYSDYWGQL
jgi:hypothetical protein